MGQLVLCHREKETFFSNHLVALSRAENSSATFFKWLLRPLNLDFQLSKFQKQTILESLSSCLKGPGNRRRAFDFKITEICIYKTKNRSIYSKSFSATSCQMLQERCLYQNIKQSNASFFLYLSINILKVGRGWRQLRENLCHIWMIPTQNQVNK